MPPAMDRGGTGHLDGASDQSGSDALQPGDAHSNVDGADGADDLLPPSDAPPSVEEADGGATHRNSLSVCWRDATCPRVLAVAHGGEWAYTGPPYLSNGALDAAFKNGADGVKIDVRVTKDNVPVLAHSSPIKFYESLDCYNKKIEEMTAAQVTKCNRVPSTSETFQRLDDVLNRLRGKLVVQLTVKRAADYARTIAEVLALDAQDFAFFEIDTAELRDLVPTLPGGDQVYYMINIRSTLSDVDVALGLKNPRAFMYEFDPDVQLGDLITTKLHPAGVRAFTYDDSTSATVQQLKAHFDAGYDVVSSQLNDRNVQARQMVNQARGVTPP